MSCVQRKRANTDVWSDGSMVLVWFAVFGCGEMMEQHEFVRAREVIQKSFVHFSGVVICVLGPTKFQTTMLRLTIDHL